jgi:hypothetical protein
VKTVEIRNRWHGSLDSHLAGDHLDDGKLEEPDDAPTRYRKTCNVCRRAIWVPVRYGAIESITCDSCVVEGSDLTHASMRAERSKKDEQVSEQVVSIDTESA